MKTLSSQFRPLIRRFRKTAHLGLCLLAGVLGIPLGIAANPVSVGPFYEHRDTESGQVTSIAPIYSSFSEHALDHHEWDLLYPLISYDQYGDERRLHVLQLFSLSGGTSNTNTTKSTTVFPFYFRQESEDPKKRYQALLPFYGTLKNRLFRDEIKVVAFPLYLQSRKKDVVTDNYLVPFFHRRHGNALQGWQVWPLAGWETKDLTTKTNVLGEVSPVGGHKKFSMAWPFYFRHQTELGTANPETAHALLPLFSSFKSPLRDSLTVPWPVGVTLTHDREKQYREVGLPWPFIVFARGEGKTANRIWPFFGNAANPSLKSHFYLWPLYRYRQLETDYERQEKTRWLFFLYTDYREKDLQKDRQSRRRALWPLFTQHVSETGVKRFQLVTPLEPLLPVNETVIRQYSPFWALWRSQHDPVNETRSQSFLWNLYRRDVTKSRVNGSALFGLVRWQRTEQNRSLKLFGMNIKRKSRPNPIAP